MSDDLQDKTEEATSKRLQDVRLKGQVARSQDFTSSAVLFVGMMVLAIGGQLLFSRLGELFVQVYTHLDQPYDTPADAIYWSRQGILFMVLTNLPILMGVLVAAFAVNVIQVGFVISMEPLNPKLKNINVFDPSSYKKFFNTTALMRLFMGLSKIGIVGVVCYFIIFGGMNDISRMMERGPNEIFALIMWQAFLIGITTALLLIILGVFDYLYQRWKFLNDQKMTKQDVKDERKQAEGDVHVKSRMRSMMQQFAQTRMKDQVPQADVIVANPVHYAIALKYDPEHLSAPLVVAKGARRMALQIRSIAEENKVPIVENPPLAQALFRSVEVGMMIPPEFYHAIAEVLAYVYRMNDQLGRDQAQGDRKVNEPAGSLV